MRRHMLSSLPSLDRYLLCTIERLVPVAEREEWSRSWQAELWHLHHRRTSQWRQTSAMTDVAIGLACDAVWLRTESWRCLLNGTARLCLGLLLGCTLLCTLFGLAFTGGWHALTVSLREPLMRCLASAPLVLFVVFATAPRRHIEQTLVGQLVFRLKRSFFFLGKVSQVFSLAFLLSMGGCYPLHTLFPRIADLYQMFAFVLLSLLGIRWALRDQEHRCKQCLQLLAAPARVGRPSHNLLEWNGTELSCRHGHGLLSIPEIETSWCQSSHWIDRGANWDLPMSI